MAKKTEQEQTIGEFQEIVISSRKKIHDLSNDNENLLRQLS